jgi:Raf kinase inhibitor-like YbhB/YbcL family protein
VGGGGGRATLRRMPSDEPPSQPAGRRRSRLVGTALALVLAAAPVLLAGCGDDGRELRAPRPDQTTTTDTTAAAPSGDAAVVGDGAGDGGDGPTTSLAQLRLSSSAFEDGGAIPVEHTCRGDDVSPPLLWTGVPADTAEIAVVVRDLDASGFVHWVVSGLPPTTTGLAQGTVPPEAVQAVNDFGRPGWSGPCPPSGTHNYEFRLFALAEPSGVTAGQPATDAIAAIEGRAMYGSAALSGQASAG